MNYKIKIINDRIAEPSWYIYSYTMGEVLRSNYNNIISQKGWNIDYGETHFKAALFNSRLLRVMYV